MNKTSSPDFFPFWVSDCPLGHCGHPHQLLIPEKPLHVDGLFVSISSGVGVSKLSIGRRLQLTEEVVGWSKVIGTSK